MPKGSPGVPQPCSPRCLQKQREILEIICRYPGITLIGAAKLLGKRRSYVEGHTASMDNGGMFLSEDDDGGLYLFRVISPHDAMELQRQIWTWGWKVGTYGDRNTSADA